MNCKSAKILKKAIVLSVALLLCLFGKSDRLQAKSQVSAKLSAKSVKVGQRIRVTTKMSNVTYFSSNSTIASVDTKGVITGKKAGKVSISVKRKGYKTRKITLTVKKWLRKPETLPVSFSEVDLIQRDGNVYVSNKSKKGKIKKIIYYYRWKGQASENTAQVASGSAVDTSSKDSTYTMNLTAKNIAAGKKGKVNCDHNKQWKEIAASHKPRKIEMYTGDALYCYDVENNKYIFQWSVRDKIAPKFSGLLKKKSYSGHGDCYRIYYSDRKDSYDYRQFVSAVDNRDGKVKIQVDKSKINWNKEGIYKIYFRASDSAGNTATTWAKVQVLKPGSAEAAADQVLNSITRKGWSQAKKARAIYDYVRKHSSYVDNAAHTQWRDAALRGLRYQSGDCYTYYAKSRLLLTRAGIPNVMIKRYPTPGGQRHFWSLAYVQGGWYHFDTTPRTRDREKKFCLLTDAQMWAFSSGYTFRFNQSLYPKRATKRIS